MHQSIAANRVKNEDNESVSILGRIYVNCTAGGVCNPASYAACRTGTGFRFPLVSAAKAEGVCQYEI